MAEDASYTRKPNYNKYLSIKLITESTAATPVSSKISKPMFFFFKQIKNFIFQLHSQHMYEYVQID